MNETGATVRGQVWTGTVRNGRAEGDHCNGWASASATAQGGVGWSTETTYRWTAALLLSCSTPMLHLYCFEQ